MKANLLLELKSNSYKKIFNLIKSMLSMSGNFAVLSLVFCLFGCTRNFIRVQKWICKMTLMPRRLTRIKNYWLGSKFSTWKASTIGKIGCIWIYIERIRIPICIHVGQSRLKRRLRLNSRKIIRVQLSIKIIAKLN